MSKHQATMRSSYALLRLALYSTLALAIILLAACDSSAKTQPTATVVRATATPLPPLPTSVIVLRFSGYPEQNRVAPFQMTAHDASKTLQLYQAARALPPFPSNPGCPQDVDIGYELSFMDGDTLVLQVLLTGGCPRAALSDPFDCRRWTPDFTARVAATLGIPVTTLEPPHGLVNTADPSGPFAQGLPTPPVLTPNTCFPPMK